MRRSMLIGAFALFVVFTWAVAADSKSNPNRPPVVVFFGLGKAAPQTPEQFDQAARKYIFANKLSFNLEASPPLVEIHISNTNAPVSVQYTEGLHYLRVEFDRDGNALGHRKGIKYVR